jgi:hypothetical protein
VDEKPAPAVTLEALLATPAADYPAKGWVPAYDKALELAAAAHPVKVPCGVAAFFKAVAVPESDWKPAEVYHEPPPLGVDSIGLLQLSVQDERGYHCGITDAASLKHPIRNLYCGVVIMEKLQKIYGSDNVYKAGGHYWSTLRRAKEWPGKKQDGFNRFAKQMAAQGCAL